MLLPAKYMRHSLCVACPFGLFSKLHLFYFLDDKSLVCFNMPNIFAGMCPAFE
uniref:Uncharacterized protein n=1 Tax=Rhizophora mucronata TaxID=61149 RepID=A0A2P2PRN3_RHIMU